MICLSRTTAVIMNPLLYRVTPVTYDYYTFHNLSLGNNSPLAMVETNPCWESGFVPHAVDQSNCFQASHLHLCPLVPSLTKRHLPRCYKPLPSFYLQVALRYRSSLVFYINFALELPFISSQSAPPSILLDIIPSTLMAPFLLPNFNAIAPYDLPSRSTGSTIRQ